MYKLLTCKLQSYLRRVGFIATMSCMLLAFFSFKADKTKTIFMVGDSTMANKDVSGDKQERGWGMMLMDYFDDDIVVDNHAVNGRSSKSFIDEGRWDEVVKSPEDKPTIGLLLCRTKSNKKAEFSLRGITQPMGIAQYETEKLFADVASALPQIEEIENKLDDLDLDNE